MPATLLMNARLDGTDVLTDVHVVDGHIHAIGSIELDPGVEAIDLEGRLVIPAAIEPHAHLDKAFLAERIANPTGDLLGAIEAMAANRHLTTVDDIAERAERAARLMASNGYVAVRTHVDVTLENDLRSVEALTAVREELADLISIEIVALCGWPVTGSGGADQRALLREAMAAGADVVGGCPHLDDDIGGAIEFFLGVATDLDVGVDLHTDETLDPTVDGLSDLCRAVLAGFAGPVTASHCVSLGQRPFADQRRVAELVAAAGVKIVTLPHTNLFLQGRGRAPMPRGLTAVAALHEAGATVAAGADNLQDPFNPVGRACPFETAGLMIMAAHLTPQEAWRAVSSAPACVLGVESPAVMVGAPAHLIAVAATTLREAIALGPADRLRLRFGRPIGEIQS